MARTTTSRRSKTAKTVKLDASLRVVVLRGKDIYLRTERLRQFADQLRERYGDIERFSFDGTSASLAEVLDELRSYGLMQKHKLVVVDEADKFLSRGDHRAAMERYVAAPMDDSSLVLRASTWNAGKLDALVEKVGAFVPCEAPSAAAAVSWCQERVRRQHACTIEPDAAELLVEHIGPQLARLDTELAKLAAAVGYERPIAMAEVEAMVGLVREEKGWEIQHAILCGGAAAGLRKLRELREVSQADDVVVMFALIDLARKIHDAVALVQQGTSVWQLSQALGIWGPQSNDIRDALARVAGRLDRHRAAALVEEAMDTQLRMRTSRVRDADRALEGLTVLLADTVE
ncbi:MAG: DNA polymerase III subunit delta [Phycisphaerales bacterium]|nr:DNA polymerase III subunit delta [Phycisphaerales bacterium]